MKYIQKAIDIISEFEECNNLVMKLNNKIIPKLSNIPTWNLMNENQKASIISFAHDLGVDFYKNKKNIPMILICDSVHKWRDSNWIINNYCNSNPSKCRRLAEAKLFLSEE